MITMKQALDYELYSSRIAPWISWSWLQDIMAAIVAGRVRRKYKQYAHAMKMREMLKKEGLI